MKRKRKEKSGDPNKPLIFPALRELDNQRGKLETDKVQEEVDNITSTINEGKFSCEVIAEDKKQKKEIYEVLREVPEQFLLNNDGVKKIVVSDDTNFLAKHDDETNVIYLSKKIFTPEYKKKRPFHRIKGVSSLTELLVHELGHAVEQNLHGKNRKVVDPLWHRVTGWVYPKSKKHIKYLKNKGYVSALSNFKNISEEDLTTLEEGDIEQIESRIKKRYPMQLPDKKTKISWYGVVSPREDWSETFTRYILDNDQLRTTEPDRYNYMKDYVFKGEVSE